MAEAKLIEVRDTRFIFRTNFAGDPENDRFKSSMRRANIIIPNEGLAQELLDIGCKVKETKPRDGEEEGFAPEYFVSVIVNYGSKWPPKIYLVSGNSDPRLLDEETVGMLDTIRASNVNAVLNPHAWENGTTLYVRTMYVEQSLEDDPFAASYAKGAKEDLPF